MSHSSFCTFILFFAMLQNEKGNLAFKTLWTSSMKHQQITQEAILQTTSEVCRTQALRQGKDFVLVSILKLNLHMIIHIIQLF